MGGSAPRRDCHLPVETTGFVDRRGELAAGRELLARPRLVTLTGPGGVGRTRLDDRYRLLGTGSPTVPPRHQTLRAAVDWSYDLCDAHEQLTWYRLSILLGTFDLDTARASVRRGWTVRRSKVGFSNRSQIAAWVTAQR
ncbi:hypothetical protein [Streptomyces sp. ATMOS53]